MSASAVFAIHKNKAILIQRDNFDHISDPGKWALPGGQLEKGETFEEALLREFEEELGVSLDNFKYLTKTRAADGSEGAVYLANLSEEQVSKLALGDEGQRWDFFSFEEIIRMDLTKDFRFYLDKYKKEVKLLLEGKEVEFPLYL